LIEENTLSFSDHSTTPTDVRLEEREWEDGPRTSCEPTIFERFTENQIDWCRYVFAIDPSAESHKELNLLPSGPVLGAKELFAISMDVITRAMGISKRNHD
jgi:hypothetical protein